ncbi:hypothetical protein EJ08DRAFT_710304 [Tothia fuscella]|uniref:Histidine kinase n=1 Tax=Tothia fuscella TaxID=1048955 RepID=A0A9P4NVI3_9PEZI|nr:hypothetical protein EJ08DRAFT_710304 [Tothia fuscella]
MTLFDNEAGAGCPTDLPASDVLSIDGSTGSADEDPPYQPPPAKKTPAAEHKERARKREIASYLSAASIPPNLEGSIYEVSSDLNITALIQLGAFRLDADRAFLSLIDKSYSYIVGEATRTNTLAKADDSLFLGVSRLALDFGVCSRTMDYFKDETGKVVINTPNVVGNTRRCVINDLRADSHYCTSPFVTGHPHMVSYIEVPLISPLGYVLGAYCVVDNKLHEFDNEETIEVLTEIASAVMTHLDLMRLKQSRVKAEKLMKGLGDFMEYESLIPNRDRRSSLRQSSLSESRRSCSQAPVTPRPDVSVDTQQRTECSTLNPAMTDPVRPILRKNASMSGYSVRRKSVSLASASPTSGGGSIGSSPVSPSHSLESNPFSHMAESKPKILSISEPTYDLVRHSENESIFSVDIQSTFGRAATIIRQSLGMDGLIFLDGCPSGFNTRSNYSNLHGGQHDASESDTADEMVSKEKEEFAGHSELVAGSVGTLQLQTRFQAADKGIREAVVQRLIRRFPRGHVFSADEQGLIDCDFGPGTELKIRRKDRRTGPRWSTDLTELFVFLPGARYIIFLPLWHFQKDTWFGATFGWTQSPLQSIDIEELQLLAAFGNSIMAEVSRVEALAVSRAKGDFINSISHELRSPLHGIMASGELLRESVKDPTLFSMLDMIDSCSTTLLDTVNSILDYSKLNNLARSSESGQHEFLKLPNSSKSARLVNLSVLVSQVVEGVHLGFLRTSLQMSPEQDNEVVAFGHEQGGQSLPDDAVLVTIHIEQGFSWMAKVDSGAWRRIIMNIFGNALKYTRSGHIEINLKRNQVVDPKGRTQTNIIFSCRDTGIGMSQEYKKYQLFQPWAQENHLSPGTGLGLSIVNQLVKDLHGSLDVQSQKGVGTTVTATLPLLPESGQPLALHVPSTKESAVSHEDAVLRSMSICHVTPSLYKETVDMEFELTSDINERSQIIQKALHSIAGDVLGMKVLTGEKAGNQDADFYFVDFHMLGHSRHSSLCTTTHRDLFGTSPMIVLCNGRASPIEHEKLAALKNTFVIRHPLAAKRLSAVLREALDAIKEKSHTDSVAPDNVIIPRSEPSTSNYETGNIEEPPSSTANESKKVEQKSAPDAIQSKSTDYMSQTPTSTPSLPESTTIANLKQQHLLLVDDNAINLRILTTLVSKTASCTFRTATNGLEAVKIYRSSPQPFDLVFMDISMPVMDGFTAIREIRRWEREQEIESCMIVALTGLGSENSKQEAFASGTNLFLTKPVKLGDIRGVMNGVREDGSSKWKGDDADRADRSSVLSKGVEIDAEGGKTELPWREKLEKSVEEVGRGP